MNSGPKVRAYHVLRYLAQRADVDLVSYTRSDDSPEALAHLSTFCRKVLAVPVERSPWRNARDLLLAIFRGRTFIIERDDQPAMRAAVASLAHDGDYVIVHADQLWMARQAHRVRAPMRVLDLHNAVYRVFERLAEGERFLPKRWLWKREARLIADHEAEQIQHFDRMLFVTQEDLDAVKAAASRSTTDLQPCDAWDEAALVAPICVDTSAIERVSVRPDANRVTMLGTMYWPPNAEGASWFAEHVLPRLVEQVPGATFTVAGKRPPQDLQRLADCFGSAMEVVGYIEDLRALLEETAVFVVPLLSGGGMRVKILDAWAWGLPVVSTTIGAEGIETVPGVDVILADEPDNFADAVADLLKDGELRQALGSAGHRAVEERYDVRRMHAALDEIYGELLGGKQ